ncbi:MAG: transcriptional repressor [Myxococcales bacterium]|nr:transcriptional repressor [Myxococcales bacterium]MCB9733967.1 transcriptional repressor [Deltaproteobacteria bacterium]
MTASRAAVLRLLGTSERPLTHQDVVDSLVGEPWNRSTLYRNLMDLADSGIAHRTVIGGLARFELAGRANSCIEHPHFVCTACGEVSHLEKASVRVDGSGLPDCVTGGEFEVQLRGRCDACHGAAIATA